MRALLTLALLTLCAFAAQEELGAAKPLEQHEWLHQLVGEWKVSSSATLEPGAEPMTWESTESVRSIGGLWIVAEGSATFQGKPFTSLLTLGYDPNEDAFVGTWVDTMQATLWTYVGHLDESERILTLESEGPSFGDPKKNALYRDQIELIGSDQRKLTSSALGDDGTWTVYMTGVYERVK